MNMQMSLKLLFIANYFSSITTLMYALNVIDLSASLVDQTSLQPLCGTRSMVS